MQMKEFLLSMSKVVYVEKMRQTKHVALNGRATVCSIPSVVGSHLCLTLVIDVEMPAHIDYNFHHSTICGDILV